MIAIFVALIVVGTTVSVMRASKRKDSDIADELDEDELLDKMVDEMIDQSGHVEITHYELGEIHFSEN